MMIVAPHRTFDSTADHLADVTAEMRKRGAPVIHALWHEGWGVWLALEGSHRLHAAHDLGLTPSIVALDWDTTVDLDELGLDLSGYGISGEVTVQQIEGWLCDVTRVNDTHARYEFDQLARGAEPTGYVTEE